MFKISPNECDIIGSRSSLSTLTAAYSDNQSNPIKLENFNQINLPVHFLAGATDQYSEILIETSNKDTLPSSDDDWEPYTTTLASAGENQLFDNPFIVPGDKSSGTGTREKRTIPIDINARWLRVSAREKTNAGGTPGSFGTIFIGLYGTEEQ